MHEVIEKLIGDFPDEYKEIFYNISSTRYLKKGEIILEQGKHCNHAWFIKNGAVKAFEPIDMTERVTHFFFDHMFFTNYYCWVTSDVSDVTLKAVENSEVLEFEYSKMEELCTKYHIFETIGRKMAENVFVQEFHLRKLLLNKTATERYEYLEKEQPEIFKRFPLKDIASFIGITDVSLSRIRKERMTS